MTDSYKKFEELLAEKGVKTIDVAKATGINPTTFTHWKQGVYSPKMEKIQLIADYFDVDPAVFSAGTIKKYGIYARGHGMVGTPIEIDEEKASRFMEVLMGHKTPEEYALEVSGPKQELLKMAVKLTDEQAEAFLPLLKNLLGLS